MQLKKANTILIDIITVLATLYGFFEAIKWSFSKNLITGILFVIIAFCIFIYKLKKELRQPILHKAYEIEKTDYVITLQKSITIDVDKDGKPIITSSREFVLLNKKGEEELFDLLCVSNNTDFNALDYISIDIESDYKVERLRKSKFKIRWKSKDKIDPLRPAKHVYSWRPSSNFNDPINYYQLFPDNLSAKQKVQIKTDKPICDFVAFKQPKIFKSDNHLYKFAFNKAKLDCSQPIRNGVKELFWELDDVEIGAIYTCVFYYEEGIEIKRRMEMSLRDKMLLFFKKR